LFKQSELVVASSCRVGTSRALILSYTNGGADVKYKTYADFLFWTDIGNLFLLGFLSYRHVLCGKQHDGQGARCSFQCAIYTACAGLSLQKL
jgi:hypothetical protein